MSRPQPAPGPIGVLHLDAGRRWGGGQNQVRLLMTGLARRGIRQLAICPAGSPLERRLREEGLPVRGVPWGIPVDPRAALAVARAAAAHRVIHAHDAHGLQLALLPAKLLGARLVASRRLLLPPSPFKWSRADRVLAVSGAVAEVLEAAGIRRAGIRTVPDGVDVDEVRRLEPPAPGLRERLGIAADAFVAGTIGRLHAAKGHAVIPDAAALLPDTRWVIVGDGPRRPALARRIRERGVGGRVHLAGELPDARRALRELDVFVFPSAGEGLGSSVLDAMAAGIPVVGAAGGGVLEVLEPVHRRTGTSLVPPGDPEALAAAVRTLGDEPSRREALVAAQRARLGDFSADDTARRTLRIYRELLGEGAGDGGSAPEAGSPSSQIFACLRKVYIPAKPAPMSPERPSRNPPRSR